MSAKIIGLIVFLAACSGVAHADTVVKTWNFASSTEGLADAGSSAAVTFQALTSTGNPTNSVEFINTTKNSNQTEFARNPVTGETWQTWGVPCGSTVTAIQVTSWSEETINDLGITASTVSFRIIGSGGTSVTSGAGDPISSFNVGTVNDSAWNVNGAGTLRSVDAGSQLYSTDVRLEIQQNVVSSGVIAQFEQGYDTIALTITYTAGSCGGGGSASSGGQNIIVVETE